MFKWFKLIATCGIGLLMAVGAVALFSSAPSLSQRGVTPLEVNIQNGGFEDPYQPWQWSVDRQIAQGWSLWYKTDWPGEDGLALPRATDESFVKREGNKAQRVYNEGAKNFDACVYQQVSGITVGHWIRFSAWGRVDNSTMSVADAQTRIGIDPSGGTDPLQIQYENHPANWSVYTGPLYQWQELSVTLRAVSTTVTVYACSHPRWISMDFKVYWDDAQFAIMSDKQVYLPAALKNLCTVPPGTLYNPDLEKEFCTLKDYQPHSGFSGYVAPYWKPFVNTSMLHPEYNKTDRDYRRYSGGTSQQFGHSAWGLFEAGIYQVVTETNPGDTLKFTIYGLGWIGADGNTNDRVSDYTGSDGLFMRVGIDPYGGEDFQSGNILWSAFNPNPYDNWNPYEITTTVVMTRVSVWVYAKANRYGMRYHQTFWDNANLSATQSP